MAPNTACVPVLSTKYCAAWLGEFGNFAPVVWKRIRQVVLLVEFQNGQQVAGNLVRTKAGVLLGGR